MHVIILPHARNRMDIYGISESDVLLAVRNPDAVVEGRWGRKIAQRRLNGHVLRVVLEEGEAIVVVTVYKARAVRYEI